MEWGGEASIGHHKFRLKVDVNGSGSLTARMIASVQQSAISKNTGLPNPVDND
jgi:hypothetical protein